MAACINAGIYKLLTAGSVTDQLLMAHNQIVLGCAFCLRESGLDKREFKRHYAYLGIDMDL